MITVRVWGGIGNQLFQYAFGEYLRLKTGQDVRYDILSFGHSDQLRTFELTILNPDIPLATKIKFSKYTKYKNRFYRLLFQLNFKNKFITESNFQVEDVLHFKNNTCYYFQGYWQSHIFPDELRKINKSCFKPLQRLPQELKIIDDEIEQSHNSVAIHVRRGDYFLPKNVNIFGVCNVGYYQQAIELLTRKYRDVRLFIFSDDLSWVKDNIALPPNAVFIPNFDVNPYWYIFLMSQCKHNVISNSSFSWWGAYLNVNKNKIVMCPKKWTSVSDKTIALLSWIQI
ncbi:MAG: alpha-1,2-fucosyltransferase [Prevotellaceae bacterium]|jgi:hypothetical protein|nr:alpha-1,2-fucosyltransferase [Prevotellaceae bacterium]